MNYTKPSYLLFYFKMFQYLQIIYCQRALKAFLPLLTRFNYLSILLIKIGSFPFFLIFWHTPIPPSSWIQFYCINYLLNSFLHALCCIHLTQNAWVFSHSSLITHVINTTTLFQSNFIWQFIIRNDQNLSIIKLFMKTLESFFFFNLS